jgi:hypothetical protein
LESKISAIAALKQIMEIINNYCLLKLEGNNFFRNFGVALTPLARASWFVAIGRNLASR